MIKGSLMKLKGHSDRVDTIGIPYIFGGLVLIGFLLLLFLFAFTYLSITTIVDASNLNTQAKHLALMDTFKTYLPVIGIILGSQIAGFAVYRNINFQEKVQKNKNKEQLNLSNKILISYLKYLQELGKEQICFFDSIKHDISSNTKKLEEFYFEKLFYNEQTNNSAFIQTINDMLSHDLHKYEQIVSIEFILNMKQEILRIMHYVKLIKEIYIPNNDRTAFIETIEEIKESITTLDIDISLILKDK